MFTSKKSYPLDGEEKERYLCQLDRYLSCLVRNLAIERNDVQHMAALTNFGNRHEWNWSRLPKQGDTYRTLSGLVDMVRNEYKWFSNIISSKNPSENRGYFDEITINPSSGLPWPFDFIALRNIKKDSDKLLGSMQSYEDLSQKLYELLTEDYVEIPKVAEAARKIQADAMRRNYLEHIETANLLGWESTGYSLDPNARKVLQLGAETLWNISCIRFSLSSGLFHAYVIDAWQDNLCAPVIDQDGRVSRQLYDALKFADDNAAWFMLKKLDEGFEGLHPVHVSRALIGPFETKYLTSAEDIKMLKCTPKLLKKDDCTGLLRFSRQYAYAPNHKVDSEGKIRQILYQDNWSDEVIVCPTQYAGLVSGSVLGTNIRIFEV